MLVELAENILSFCIPKENSFIITTWGNETRIRCKHTHSYPVFMANKRKLELFLLRSENF